MNCDELIDHVLLEEQDTKTSNTVESTIPVGKERPSKGEAKPLSASPAVSWSRQRLPAVAAGRSTKQYLGRLTTAEKVDDLTEEETEKLYA